MLTEKYSCEGAACLAIAARSKSADLQALWLMMAQAWFQLAKTQPRYDILNIVALPNKQMSPHAHLAPVAKSTCSSRAPLVNFIVF